MSLLLHNVTRVDGVACLLMFSEIILQLRDEGLVLGDCMQNSTLEGTGNSLLFPWALECLHHIPGRSLGVLGMREKLDEHLLDCRLVEVRQGEIFVILLHEVVDHTTGSESWSSWRAIACDALCRGFDPYVGCPRGIFVLRS